MAIPANLLMHPITVEAYLGDAGRGPLYGPPVPVLCYLEQKTKVVRGPDGREVTSSTRVFCNRGPTFTTESRVTLADGRQPKVLQVADLNTRGLVPVDHLEISLE